MFGKTRENFRIAIATLLASKTRAALTMLGITIGVASVVLLLSLGQAFESYVVGQFSSFGSNIVAIFGKVSNTVDLSGPPGEADAETQTTIFESLSWNDYLALNDRFRVPDASVVAPVANILATARSDENELAIAVAGVTEGYNQAVSLELAAGRFITEEEVQSTARVAVLNFNAVDKLFGPNVYPIGQMIKLNGLSFEVIGVLDLGANNGSDPESLVIPITTLYQRLSSTRLPDGSLPVAVIMMQALDSAASDRLLTQAKVVLREEHKLDPDDEDDFQVFAQTEILASLSAITGLITVFLSVIAGISLIVGGIGVMNIMLVTVTERTSEIGLRKAVGAQNNDILLQFITESILLSVLGGILGTVLAFLGTIGASQAIPDLSIVVQPSSVILAMSVSAFIGVFFGAFPANRAAKMNPIDALRSE